MRSIFLSGEDYIARRILLEKCITQLCVFFGQQKANDLILSHMITFLNNKTDWRLRAAFFDCVVNVTSHYNSKRERDKEREIQMGECNLLIFTAPSIRMLNYELKF